jgi:hypothetical protein
MDHENHPSVRVTSDNQTDLSQQHMRTAFSFNRFSTRNFSTPCPPHAKSRKLHLQFPVTGSSSQRGNEAEQRTYQATSVSRPSLLSGGFPLYDNRDSPSREKRINSGNLAHIPAHHVHISKSITPGIQKPVPADSSEIDGHSDELDCHVVAQSPGEVHSRMFTRTCMSLLSMDA